MKRFLGILISMVFVLGLGFCQENQETAKEKEVVEIGKPAPDFILEDIDGNKIQLGKLQGRVIILDFWATWCKPCTREMKLWQEIYEKYECKGLVVITVNCGEEKDIVKKFAKDNGYTFLFLVDEKREAVEKYNVWGIPATFFIDKKGVLIDQKTGEIREEDKEKFLKWLEKVLEKNKGG